MPLRTTVSRIAARGVTQPADTEGQPEVEHEQHQDQAETPTRGGIRDAVRGSNRYAGASRPAVEEASEEPSEEPTQGVPEPAPKARRQGRPAGSGRKALQTVPALVGTESPVELRAKIKETENLIREARLRHDEEMKTLKTTYAELHARMFDHVK